MGDTLVFIEANPFASRLHVLTPLIEGSLAAGAHVVLVTRNRVGDQHWTDWVRDLPPSVVHVQTAEKPMLRPGGSRPLSLLKLIYLARKAAGSGKRPRVVFTATDDYTLAFAIVSPVIRFAARSVVVIRYRVDGLLSGARVRARLVATALRGAIRVSGARLVVFDERLAQQGVPVDVIPDPWQGAFGIELRAAARDRLAIHGSDPVIGLIGHQSRRKGFDVATEAARLIDKTHPGAAILLLGDVDPQFQSLVESLHATFGNRFIHVAEFVPDEDLPTYFAACDVIWLPYDRTFTATSGVLVRAAATGVPVVASSHGLIGHRVLDNDLGRTFRADQPSGLARATSLLLTASHEELENRSRSSRFWAEKSRSAVVADEFRRLVEDM